MAFLMGERPVEDSAYVSHGIDADGRAPEHRPLRERKETLSGKGSKVCGGLSS